MYSFRDERNKNLLKRSVLHLFRVFREIFVLHIWSHPGRAISLIEIYDITVAGDGTWLVDRRLHRGTVQTKKYFYPQVSRIQLPVDAHHFPNQLTVHIN